MKFTSQQAAAVGSRGQALLVEAGAGTGKTAVLVARFLHLLEAHPTWPLDGIVAVTFTEKAAHEMRHRIRQEVERRAVEDPESPWSLRQRELERLQVGTIHSLCAHLLRTHAIAAGLDPRFAVLDEQAATFLQAEALERTLAALAEQEEPALTRLTDHLRLYDLHQTLSELLGQRALVVELFERLPPPATLLAQWAQELAQMRHELWHREGQAPAVQAALDGIARLSLPAGTDKLIPYVEQAQAGCRLLAAGELGEAMTHFASSRLNVGSQNVWGGKEALQEIKAWLRELREAARRLEQSGALAEIGEADERAAELLHAWRTLWQALQAEYQALKGAQQALDFDDLELMSAALLKQPGVREAIRATLHYVLVDEFQDTNRAQQEILLALAPPDDAGRLFLVGDAKQSIYRFRQAQVTLFNETAQQLHALTGQGALSLTRSFRTHQQLVAALNPLFEHVFQPLGGQYQPFEARPMSLQAERAAPRTLAAPVELLLLPKKTVAGDSLRADEARRWEARWLAERLQALKESGFPVWDKKAQAYRAFRYGDAAILLRATTIFPLYEEQFNAVGLPFLTVSGRGYYQRPEVQDLITLLRALQSPEDELSLAALLRSPLCNLSDESLYRLRWHDPAGQRLSSPRPYRAALAEPPPTDQEEAIGRAVRLLEMLEGMRGRVTVSTLLRHALDQSGYEATLALSEGSSGRQQHNVQKFMELARTQGGHSLTDFLQRIHRLQAQEAREGEALTEAPDAAAGTVQLMSIHAAKGLEFPVVAVADLGRAERGGAQGCLLYDPALGVRGQFRDAQGEWQRPASYRTGQWQLAQMEQAESKRLLYVACTRAADLLLLSGRVGRSGSWLDTILAGWEIEPVGAEEEIQAHAGFALRVYRPSVTPIFYAPPLPTPPESAGLHRLPPLMAPLPTLPLPTLPTLTPVLPSAGSEQRLLAARLLHPLLPEWPAIRGVEAHLQAEARRLGLAGGAAIGQARALLAQLEGTPLFQEIAQARQRYPRLPFTVQGSEGEIELLYQSAQGVWRIVSWLLEPAPSPVQLAQLEQAAQAVGASLGGPPQLTLCVLAPQLACYAYRAGQLFVQPIHVQGE